MSVASMSSLEAGRNDAGACGGTVPDSTDVGSVPKADRETYFPLVFAGVLLLFFATGASALLYQVVWTRKLTLLFGTTAYAVSTVLTVFFLGLGVGSLLGGRLADRTRRPMFWYGLLGVGIGLWAGLFMLVMPLVEPLVPGLLRLFDFARPAGIVLRAMLALGLLCVPVIFMGATLPLLARYVTRAEATRGSRIGALYAANTLGAVTGCFVTGFFLIAALGYAWTTLAGMVLNVAAGVGALLLSRFTEPLRVAPSSPSAEPAAPVAAAPAGSASGRSLLLLSTAVCGFTGLALEVIYTRLLAIVFLGTTYAYTTMLTTFLCGIALGGACAAAMADRLRRLPFVIGLALMLTAICSLWMLGWTARLPERMIDLQRAAGGEWPPVVRGMFLLSFRTLFPVTFLFGMAFPLILKAYGGAATAGRSVGRLYAANTFGGVLGAVAGGFLLLPLLGAHRGLLLLSVLPAAAGLLLLLRCAATPVRGKVPAAACLLALYALAWSAAPEDVTRALNVGYIPEDHRVLFFREGSEGTVVVSEPVTATAGEDRVLWINRVQATTSVERGVKMNRLQGVLPLLFERDFRDVLFMCFGSGITCGTLALHDFDSIDAVEISPEVLEAAPLFARDNLGVLDNPRVNLIVDDGRNYLLRTPRRYDVITFEPMPMALSGVSTFYTREYYELCLDRLNPGGIVSQWVPLHSSSPEVVRALARTFISVFPEYCAFFVNADLFLIGSNAPLRMHFDKARARLEQPRLFEALTASGLGDVVEIVASYLFDKEGLRAFAGSGPIMTDNRPWAEFVAPKLVYARLVPQGVAELLPHMAHPLDAMAPGSIGAEDRAALDRRHRSRRQDIDALRHFYGGSILDDTAANAFIAALETDPGNLAARYYLGEIATAQAAMFLRWDETDRAKALLRRVQPFLPDHLEIGALLKRVAEPADNQGP